MSDHVIFSELFDSVKARLETDSPGTVVAFGAREVGKQINQGTGRANRVVFVPDDDGGLGDYAPPRSPGGNPRVIWELTNSGRVYVWAYDGTGPEDERKQFDACIRLHNSVVRSIQRFASGKYKLRRPRNTSAVVERRFGYEIVFVVEICQPVPGVEAPDTGAVTGAGPVLFVGPSGSEEPVC